MSMNDCEHLEYLIGRARANGLSPAEGIEIAAAVEQLRDELNATHELVARTHRAYYELARTLYRREEKTVGNSMSGGHADTVVQAATVNGGISTGAHTVINEPTGPVNTGDGDQIVTTYSGTITQHVGQGQAVVGDVHGDMNLTFGDQS
ncbi:hypothetical protein [Streptomyces xiamenensis]|uniref:hypothetical protein n=1 Tax=Streptomyces xiamenensis TaxID=408015 RepID=UPI003D707B15